MATAQVCAFWAQGSHWHSTLQGALGSKQSLFPWRDRVSTPHDSVVTQHKEHDGMPSSRVLALQGSSLFSARSSSHAELLHVHVSSCQKC